MTISTLSPESLFEANQALMFWMANRFIWKEYLDRDDIIQEARIGLWQASLEFDAGKGWTFSTIAVNRMKWRIWRAIQLEWKQKRGRHQTVGDKDQEDGLTQLAVSREPAAEDIAIQKDELSRFNSILDKIAQRDAELLRGRADGKTLREIGEDRGVSHERIRQRLLNAFAQVRHVAELQETQSVLEPIQMEQILKEVDEQKQLESEEKKRQRLKRERAAEIEERLLEMEREAAQRPKTKTPVVSPKVGKRRAESALPQFLQEERDKAARDIQRMQERRLARLNASTSKPYDVSSN